MKKLVIDENTCLCCGSCVGNWGELFDWGETTPCVKSQELAAKNPDKVEEAIAACPAGAIKYEETDEEK